MTLRGLCLTLILLTCGCAVRSTRQASSSADADFLRAQKLFGEQKYADAQHAFASYLQTYGVSDLTLSAHFYLGRCYESEKDFTNALNEYRKVAAYPYEGGAQAKQLKAMASYRMSFAFEALHRDSEMLATLLDAEKREANLPQEVVGAELPARIALAYTKVGSVHEAAIYFARAEAGFKKLEKSAAIEVDRDWLAQILLAMGQTTLSEMDPGEIASSQAPLGQAQEFLLRAVDLAAGENSQKAAETVSQFYSRSLKFLSSPSIERQQQVATAQALADLLDQAHDWSPEILGPKTTLQADLVSQLDKTQRELNLILFQGTVQTILTPEARQQEGLVRPGEVVDPQGLLEKRKAHDSR